MSTPLLDYLKSDCLELIQEEQFAEIYKKILANRNYAKYVGELTELILKCEGDPLEGLDFIPTGFLKGVTFANNIKLSKKITKINTSSFSDCPSVRSIDLNNNFTRLPHYCFSNCTALESVTGIDNVKCLDGECFWGCTSLKHIDLGKSLIYIGNEAFASSGLESLVLHDDATVCTNAFANCTRLKSLELGAYLVRHEAFSKCTALTEVKITNLIGTLDNDVFDDCHSLTAVTFAGTKDQWNRFNKSPEWRGNAPIKVVHCSDGDVKMRK